MRHGFDPKEREHALNLMFEYESNQGFTPEMSEQKLAFFFHPVSMVTNIHSILNFYYDMAVSLYVKTKKDQTIDKLSRDTIVH